MNAIVPYGYEPVNPRAKQVSHKIICLPAHAPSTRNVIHNMDALAFLSMLATASVHCAITSPPYYGLRSYLAKDHPLKHAEIGLEETPDEYIQRMVVITTELHRVLHPMGSLWLNLGDTYSTHRSSTNISLEAHDAKSGLTSSQSQKKAREVRHQGNYRNSILPEKNLLNIPHRVAIALQESGWYLRSTIPWVKANPMPESVVDRPTNAHEYWFLLTKSQKYYADPDSVRHGRNIRTSDFWNTSLDAYENQLDHIRHIREKGGMLLSETDEPLALMVTNKAFKGAHFATFPTDLIEPLVKFSCPEKVCAFCGNPIHGCKPTCECDADTRKGLVLDIFAGSGTVGLVARNNFRDYILNELNPDYIDIINERLRLPNMQPTTSEPIKELPLFALLEKSS